MPKPNYIALFAQLETETDPIQRQLLLDQIYDFSPPSPLPPGESIEDYLLTPEEDEKFAYVEDDYVEPNPGVLLSSNNDLFVAPDYVLSGYINTETAAISPYMLEGYAAEGFVVNPGSIGDFSAYVGVYYSDLGETT